MNKNLLKYINSLPELGMRIFLHLAAEATGNGNSIVNYRQLASMFQSDELTIKKVLNLAEAKKKNAISIQQQTESSTVINFKYTGMPEGKLIPKPIKEQKRRVKEKKIKRFKNEMTKAATQKHKNKKPLTKTEKQFLPEKFQSEKPIKGPASAALVLQSDIPIIYGPSFADIYTENIKRDVIYDYCQFYKSIQANISIMAGIPFDHIPEQKNPNITGRDIKAFKDLAQHFIQLGCKNGDQIKQLFQKIYKYWDHLPSWLQNMFGPAQILYNINKIRIEIQKSHLNHTDASIQQKNELQKSANRISEKDYSFLEKKHAK